MHLERLIVGLLAAGSAHAQVFVCDPDVIRAFDHCGEELPYVCMGLANPYGLALWPQQESLVWSSPDTDSIYVVGQDGSGCKETAVIVDPGKSVSMQGIDIDGDAAMVYWASGSNAIRRASLVDGGTIDTLADNLSVAEGIVLDVDRGLVFFSDEDTGTIWVANLDGSDREVFHANEAWRPGGLAIARDDLFWTDLGGTIMRAPLDGGPPSPFVSDLASPIDLAVDDEAGYLYWTDFGTHDETGDGTIGRVRLDGTDVDLDFVSNLFNPRGVVMIPAPPCAADINDDCMLNIEDFVAFQVAFLNQEPVADCDDDGVFSVLDFVCYQAAFLAGCGR